MTVTGKVPTQPVIKAPVVFTAPNPNVRRDQSRNEFSKKFDKTVGETSFRVGTKVKVIRVTNPRKGEETVILRGKIKSLTTVGAYCYDPEKDRSGSNPEWFPFTSKMCRMVLG